MANRFIFRLTGRIIAKREEKVKINKRDWTFLLFDCIVETTHGEGRDFSGERMKKACFFHPLTRKISSLTMSLPHNPLGWLSGR
jgi:hypothetical protein